MKSEELNIYKLPVGLSDKIWKIVVKWDCFSKETPGKQLVSAADAITANLSVGFGRYHNKENTNFCYYSSGS